MPAHDIDRLAKQITTLQKELTKLADSSELETLLRHIHGPGYTTPAELKFVSSIVLSLDRQVRGVGELKTNLLAGSHEIVVKGHRLAA
jgi:hypothetical protein